MSAVVAARVRSGVARGLVAVLAAGSVLLGFGVGPAAANSSVGLAQNAWLVSELGAQAANAYYQSPAAQTASAAELAAASTATRASNTRPGFLSKPAPGSKLGLVVNGIAVLGTAAFMFMPGDDDAPEVPLPADAGGGVVGSPSYGFCQPGRSPCVFGGTANSGTQTQGKWTGIQASHAPAESKTPEGTCYRVTESYNASGALISRSGVGTTYNCGLIVYSHQVGGYYKRVIYPATQAGVIVGAGFVALFSGDTYAQPPAPEASTTPRYIDTTVTCKSPGGGSQVLTRRDGPFTFDPAVGGDLPVDVPSMECPEGTWLDSGKRDLATEGTTETVPIEDYSAPGWVETQVVRFPDCFPVGGTPCELGLVFIGTGGAEKQCSSFALGAENPCYQWLRQPDRDQTFGCKFGPYSIGLRACRPLKDRYNPTPLTQPSSPSDPANPDPDEPEPPYDPDAPPVDPTPEVTPDLNADGCIPTGWNLLNPFAYFKATGCALKWAFVPTQMPDFGGIPSPLPVGWLPSMPDLGSASCGPLVMPRLRMGWADLEVGPTTMLNTCDDPWPLIRSFTYNGLLALVLVGVTWQGFRVVTEGLGVGVDGGGSDRL